jgi:hypothetical protein
MAKSNTRVAEIATDFDDMERAYYWVKFYDLSKGKQHLIKRPFRTMEDAKTTADAWQYDDKFYKLTLEEIGG